MRGGKRPGAGAPRGNLNAVKHGKFSKQVRRAMSKTRLGEFTNIQEFEKILKRIHEIKSKRHRVAPLTPRHRLAEFPIVSPDALIVSAKQLKQILSTQIELFLQKKFPAKTHTPLVREKTT